MSSLIDQARAFADEDPDPESRDELRALVARAQASDAPAVAELADRFSAPLDFGTAGLRGRVEGGLARMNRVVVIKAAHGLGTHLLSKSEGGGLDARRVGVLIGFDGRYSSRQFAEDTAAVLAGLGIPSHLFPDPVPTPLCSFATVHVGAAAGVMVTASHNPPKDNGYKVYRADGAQIIPPEDQEIAALIAAAPRVPQIARVAPPDAAAAGLRRIVDDSVEAAYLAGIRRATLHAPEPTPLRIVYTAMHGVGHRLAIRVFRQAGFEGVAVEPAQADADGAFRTVAFPNPEEKGAMDRSLALAREVGADLILANDPDADRLGAAVLDRANGTYRMLSGNEIGILLADDALAHADTQGRPKLVATSLVSSTLLSRMARDQGAVYAETLTGFKWIADAARKGEAAGQAFVFGYEEALGYTVGPLVRDKDGIGAAVRLADRARFLKGRGVSLLDRIDEILVAHGMSHEVQWSVTLSDAAGKKRIAAAMEALRADPPKSLGESPIHRVFDLEAGVERAGGATKPLSYPRANVLVFYAEDGARLTVRPSGTEPKIKFYVELVAPVKTAADVAPARAGLEARCGEIKAAINQRLGFA
jgi:phosphomannomutase